MKKVKIRLVNQKDGSAWDEYVMQHPRGTVFHLTGWKDVVESSFGHKPYYLIAVNRSKLEAQSTNENCIKADELFDPTNSTNSSNQIVGILPIFRIKSVMFGDYLVSVPFAELGGVLADDKTLEKILLQRAVEIADELNCDYFELRNREAIEGLKTKDLYYNFKGEIFSELDENLKAIPRKARRMVRQGDKFGLIPEFGNHNFNEFYNILAKSYHRLGTPIFSKRLFKQFLKIFGEKSAILLIRNKEKIPVAGVLSFFFKDQIIPYYAGSDFVYRKLAPNDFMFWQLIKYGCENDFKVFDFGRSKADTGSFHFKRHWGFEPTRLAYQYYLIRSDELPNLSPANPKYQKKIEMWRKLPISVTKIIGPFISKYLA